ncbi:MAG: hypothetical protein IPM77_03590 [Crocinitomicaceae bacterium]|nr:hypothetical protein [Crocinitomicaceae bacterium]
MKLLNQLKYRVVFSVILSGIYVLISNFWKEDFRFDIISLLAVAVIIYIPLTVIWAIVSTFFLDEKDNSNDEIIDQ